MSCNDCTEKLFQTLGYSDWVPQSYGINDVVINPGNSNLYVSLVENNTTAPAQPGSLWSITTVAELIASSSSGDVVAQLGYFPWNGSTPYSQNEGVFHNGAICVSSIPGENTNLGNTPGSTSDANWGVYTYFEFLQRWILNHGAFT